jgi:hypothetical protein
MDPKQSFFKRILGGLKNFGGSTTTFNRQSPPSPLRQTPVKQFDIPPAIPQEQRQLFVRQAQKAGISPDEFGTIAKREQGPLTAAANVALVGGADPTDRGVMQVNKVNEPLIQQRFVEEFGRSYNPNNAEDSIIAARMVLEENRRIFEQMIANKSLEGGFTSEDLINSYNLGPKGVVEARQGDKIRVDRLNRYKSAGIIN